MKNHADILPVNCRRKDELDFRWGEFPGAAPFTALVKDAGLSPARNTPRARKRRIAIGQREKRIEDWKTRTLIDRKGAAPDNQNRSKTVLPALRN